MQLSCPIKVENRRKGFWVAVKEKFVVDQRVVVAELRDGFVGIAVS